MKKGGTAFVTEEINEKVLKSLQKMAEQQNKSIQIVQQGSIDDLKKLLALVTDEIVSANYYFLIRFNIVIFNFTNFFSRSNLRFYKKPIHKL